MYSSLSIYTNLLYRPQYVYFYRCSYKQFISEPIWIWSHFTVLHLQTVNPCEFDLTSLYYIYKLWTHVNLISPHCVTFTNWCVSCRYQTLSESASVPESAYVWWQETMSTRPDLSQPSVEFWKQTPTSWSWMAKNSTRESETQELERWVDDHCYYDDCWCCWWW